MATTEIRRQVRFPVQSGANRVETVPHSSCREHFGDGLEQALCNHCGLQQPSQDASEQRRRRCVRGERWPRLDE